MLGYILAGFSLIFLAFGALGIVQSTIIELDYQQLSYALMNMCFFLLLFNGGYYLEKVSELRDAKQQIKRLKEKSK